MTTEELQSLLERSGEPNFLQDVQRAFGQDREKISEFLWAGARDGQLEARRETAQQLAWYPQAADIDVAIDHIGRIADGISDEKSAAEKWGGSRMWGLLNVLAERLPEEMSHRLLSELSREVHLLMRPE